MKILGRNFPIFRKAVKWVCRPSQVIGDDGKSIEDKLEEISTNGGINGGTNEGSSGGSQSILDLTLWGQGNNDSGNYHFTILDPSQGGEDEGGGGDPKKATKDSPSYTSIVLKSEVDAIRNAPIGQWVGFNMGGNENGYHSALGIISAKQEDSVYIALLWANKSFVLNQQGECGIEPSENSVSEFDAGLGTLAFYPNDYE